MSNALNNDEVRKIAKLARLEIPEADLGRMGEALSAILGYAERLGSLDLEGVDPMAHVGDDVNRLGADEPGESGGAFSNETVIGLAPESVGPFISVPKIIGEGGGA